MPAPALAWRGWARPTSCRWTAFGTLRSSGGERLPKRLSDTTLELVLRTLGGARSGLGAADVARAAGLSRVTARRYLEHLCRLDRAELTLRYGTPGRPEHRYRLVRSS